MASDLEQTPASGPDKGPGGPKLDETPTPHGECPFADFDDLCQQTAKDIETVDDMYRNQLNICTETFEMLGSLFKTHANDRVPVPLTFSAHLAAGPAFNIKSAGTEFYLLAIGYFQAISKAKRQLHFLSRKLDKYRESRSETGEDCPSEFEALWTEHRRIITKVLFNCAEKEAVLDRFGLYCDPFNRQMAKVGSGHRVSFNKSNLGVIPGRYGFDTA